MEGQFRKLLQELLNLPTSFKTRQFRPLVWRHRKLYNRKSSAQMLSTWCRRDKLGRKQPQT